MSAVEIAVERLPHGQGLELPRGASPGAAGLDVCAAVERDVVLARGARMAVPTGFRLALPPGYEAQIRPRSGLALEHGVTVLNSPGTVDSDYRGEVRILLVNHGDAPFTVSRGDRIAQLLVAPVARARCVEAADLDATERGEGGFGSTGTTPLEAP